MTDFNGYVIEAVIPGDRGHFFTLPRDRSTVPAKTLETVEAMEKATAAYTAKTRNSPAALAAANEAVRKAVANLYETASATSRARREFHQEQYVYAEAKFDRALGEARTALQQLADHAQQAAHPEGVGFNPDPRSNSKTVMGLRLLADVLTNMPAVPELED